MYQKANWEILQKRYPDTAERLENAAEKQFEMEFLSTREDGQSLTVKHGEENVRLNSAYRPLQEAVKWADQYAFQNIGVYVLMFGMGNGIFVRELLKRLGKDNHLFLMEPNGEILSAVLENEDISDILKDKRLHLYVGTEDEDAFRKTVGGVVNWDNLVTQIRCEHPGYQKLLPEEYNHFWDIVKRLNEVVITQTNTNAYFAHQAIENILFNLSYVKESNYISEFIGKIPEEVPAVIVSAGPSLDKNAEELRRMAGHALIIATDTAVRVLEERGLPYDCMVTVDPAKPAWYLKNYPGCSDVPLLLTAEAQKEITEFHTGRKIWMPGGIYLCDVYAKHGYRFPAYDNGGSVATSAFWIAKVLGLKNIVLIGQDLAFMGESTHAGGHEDHIKDEESGICMIEGIDGEDVRSRRDWVYYLHWFEEMIQQYPELNVIDATEGGALIHGSEVMQLAEVTEKYCGVDFSFAALLEDLPRTFEVNDFTPLEEEFGNLDGGFDKTIAKAKEGIKYAEEFLERAYSLSAKRHDRLIKDIKKANNYIGRQAGYSLIESYSADLTVGELRDINCITGDPVQDEINSVKSAKALYESFLKAAEQMKKLLAENRKA